jgi:hypothetical protein
VLRNGYTSLADLKARWQQQPTATATSSIAPDHLQASHSPQKNTSADAPQNPNISDILVRVRMASGDEHELQIIYDTIVVQAAALAWTIQEGVIYYDNRLYVLAISPLLQDSLESLDMIAPNLLAIGFHSAASDPALQVFLSSILLLEPWLTQPLPSATIVFFDNNGQQFISINDVNINVQESGHPLISPAYDTTGDTLFGVIRQFDITPTSQVLATVCKHFRGIVKKDN